MMVDMTEDNLVYQIALTLLPGVGDVLGRKLVTLCGSAEAVFREPKHILKKMPRIGNLLAQYAGNSEILTRAEQEVSFIERYRITPLFIQDKGYPHRLKHCLDCPVMLFYKGTADLNSARIIGIVGTRNATDYGKSVTRELVGGLARQQVLVVSGLAYGIDSCAHRFSLDFGLDTIGVLGHGLDTVYPWLHRPLAEKMLAQGGLVTEFLSKSRPDRSNFPRRNRIIAGLCDAVIVVEAGRKGGALITADIANSYNRDVFAVPGRITDPFSDGTNYLIRTNRAALVQKADDIEYLMGWKEQTRTAPAAQRKIFIELTPDDEKIVGLLQENGQMCIDEICVQTATPMSKVSASLLNLEFEGIVKCMPGKLYSLL
ncbi:MAG: DNA-processing protein DprA [Bacteroidetes bacterium]|nr:DNA-processing protein DprA [Bacteroidota bacterium]